MKFGVKYRGKEEDVPGKALNAAADKLSKINQVRLAQSASFEMRKYLTRVSDALHQRHGGAWPGGTTNTSLSKRSGKGLRSVKNFIVRIGDGGVVANIRLNNYMAFHERGGWIKARNGKYLTIPLRAALDARGVPLRARARDWPNSFIIKSRAGNLLIVHKVGDQIEPLYVLKKSVRIRARLGLRKELRTQRVEFRRAVFAEIRALAKGQKR